MKKMRYNEQGWGVLPHRPSNTHTGQTTRKSRIGHDWVTHYHLFPFGQRSGEFNNQHCMLLDERFKWNGYPATLIGES